MLARKTIETLLSYTQTRPSNWNHGSYFRMTPSQKGKDTDINLAASESPTCVFRCRARWSFRANPRRSYGHPSTLQKNSCASGGLWIFSCLFRSLEATNPLPQSMQMRSLGPCQRVWWLRGFDVSMLGVLSDYFALLVRHREDLLSF